MPVPINFPHLSVRVWFFSGTGMGGPKKPQGCPCRTLPPHCICHWCVCPSSYCLSVLNPLTSCAVTWDGRFKKETKGDSFSTMLKLVLNCACFIYFGAW